MPKIVITDSDFESNDFEFAMARAANVEIAAFQGPKPQDIIRNAADADAIVTSYGTFTPEVFAALPNLQVVSRTGIGYDTIDVPAATKNKTAVCVVPGYGTEVVSDHAITLALCVLRRMNETDADMRAGIWDYARHRPLGQVYGRTFGVVGMGEIGRATARRARLPRDLHVALARARAPHTRGLRHRGIRGAASPRRRGKLPHRAYARHAPHARRARDFPDET